MSAKKLVLQNTAAQITAKAISSITTFIITLFIARIFGSTGFGEFTKITAYVGFFYLLSDFGLNAIFILISSEKVTQLRKQIGSFIIGRLLLSFGLVVILLSVLPLIPGNATDGFTATTRMGIVLFSITVIAQAIITTTNALFQKTLSYHYHAKAVAIGSLTTLLLIGVATFTGFVYRGLLPFVGLLAIGWVAMAVASVWFVHRKIKSISFDVDWAFIRTLVSRGWMLGAVLFATVIMSQTSRLIMSMTRPTAEVGVFGLAVKFFEFPLTIPIFFINSIYPLLVADRKSNKHLLRLRLAKSFFILLGGGILAATLLYTLAPLLVLIKSDFAASVPIFRLLVLFVPVYFLSALAMWTFIVFDRRKTLLIIYGAGALVHVVVASLYIPAYGAHSAALLIGITESAILVVSTAVLFVNRKMLYDKT